eukprot:2204283-Rhodomonas_salina.3
MLLPGVSNSPAHGRPYVERGRVGVFEPEARLLLWSSAFRPEIHASAVERRHVCYAPSLPKV